LSALPAAITRAKVDSCIASSLRWFATEVAAKAANTNIRAVAVESSEMMVSFWFRLERSKFGILIPQARRNGPAPDDAGLPLRNANSRKKKIYVQGEGWSLRDVNVLNAVQQGLRSRKAEGPPQRPFLVRQSGEP
jgi:hypothetical protein